MENSLIAHRDIFTAANPEQRQTVNAREWGVIRKGISGPALVLIPGTLGRADIFWNQIDALQPHARILAITYPDSGGIQEWADDICTLMDQNHITSATILGSSLGGYLAQYFAATYPDRTDNLIAANTLPAVDFLARVPPYSADLDALEDHELMQGFMDGLTQWAVDEPTRAELVDLLTQEVSGRIPGTQLRARLKALKHGPPLPPQSLDKSNIFTVESDDDRLIPEPIRAAVRAQLNPQRAKHFKNGSHFPYVTYPNDYTAMIAKIIGVGAP